MKKYFGLLAAILIAGLTGCSTTQTVMLAKLHPTKPVTVVSRLTEGSNSLEMDSIVETAFKAEGVSMKAPLPAGTRTAPDVDAIVSYADTWRWDLVMYLKSMTIRMFDAQSGDLLVIGEWKDSALHGFRDAKLVTQGLVTEMLAQLRNAKK